MTEPHYDATIYPRSDINWARVDQFAVIMAQSGWGDFPPILVGRVSGAIYDGVHRFHAALKAGIKPKFDYVDDPAAQLGRILLGALSNRHGINLTDSEKRKIAHTAWEQGKYDVKVIAHALGVGWERVREWAEEFQNVKNEADNKLTPEQEAKRKMLDKGERIVQYKGQEMFKGSYSPDTPPDKVFYLKQADKVVIDYSSVVVEGQEVGDLVIELRRVLRRVAWVKEAAIHRMMGLEDVSLFDEAGTILSRSAMMRKSGSAPVTVLPAKHPQEQHNLL